MKANEWEYEDDLDDWDTYTDEELAFLKLSIILGSVMILFGMIARMF